MDRKGAVSVEITEVRIKLVSVKNDKLRAFCSITLDNEFVIRDLKVIEGVKGAFVAMPSRKLTDRCPRCGDKNHYKARFCNNCGTRLPGDRMVRAEGSSQKIHTDIAHPINSRCREAIQTKVLEVYHAELQKSSQPGYQPMELEVFDADALVDDFPAGGETEAPLSTDVGVADDAVGDSVPVGGSPEGVGAPQGRPQGDGQPQDPARGPQQQGGRPWGDRRGGGQEGGDRGGGRGGSRRGRRGREGGGREGGAVREGGAAREGGGRPGGGGREGGGRREGRSDHRRGGPGQGQAQGQTPGQGQGQGQNQGQGRWGGGQERVQQPREEHQSLGIPDRDREHFLGKPPIASPPPQVQDRRKEPESEDNFGAGLFA
jgi:stage V sporulation protein G